MKIRGRDALRAAHAAAEIAETTQTMKLALLVANLIDDVQTGGALTEYGLGYKQALRDVFDRLQDGETTPVIPPQVWGS